MRKLFLLLPALVLSLFANAKEIEISSSTSNIIHSTIAASTTSDGDIIVLTDAGPYVNSKANNDDYTKIAKNVTIKAADGIQPVIKFEVPIQARDGKSGKFIGIKFDGSSLQYDHFIYFKDGNDNDLEFEDCEFYNSSKYIVSVPASTKANSLVFKNCKFYNNSTNRGILNQGNIGRLELDGCEVSNFVKEFIHGYSGTSHVDECVVNDCYFHDNSRSSIMFVASTVDGTQTCDQLTVTNSTFANIDASGEYESVIDIRPYGTAATDAIQVLVDHCTFYNNTVKNSDHANIRTAYLSDVTVSNCIFYYPSEYATRATYCTGGGNINNCLTYNYTAEGTKGHAYGATVNAASIVADPLFNNLANNKYTFAGDWTTTPMSLSPARGAATDGSDLGDPRWYTAETLPSTNFASPYILLGEKAILSGSFALNGNNYIQSQNSTTPGLAIWKIQAERQGSIQVTLNIAADNTSGHRYEIAIYDAENNLVGTPLAESENAWSAGDKILGSFDIPAVGNYTIKLTNDCNYSSTILEGITLTYLGGAVIPVSPSANTTLNIADALFSGCTRDADYIQFPSSGTSSAWIKWNISTSETAFYDITLNIDAPNAHGLTVEVFENEAEPAVASVSEGSYVSSTGVLALALGRINLVGGKNYIVKVTNAPSGSTAKITSLSFAPVVSSTINLPDVLPFNQAVLSTNAHVTDSKLYFAPIGDTNPVGEWAQWAVTTDHDGLFLFTMNVNSDNGQSYRISILDDGENLIDSYEHKPSSGAQTITHYFALPVGNYSVKVENTTAWSRGYLTSLVVTEPSVVTIDETATDNSTWASKVEDSNTYDVQIFRSLRAGMYNTFCLPFAVASDMCKDVFGNDVEIYTLDEAIVDGEVLNVTLKNSDGIYQGTPVFIKPSTDIVNPIFTGVEFKSTTPAATTKTNANFVGTFVSTTLTANSDILYLGPDNTLYYPETDTPIKGFRAWFTIHGAAAPVIRRMNIIERTGEATSINLINDAKNDGKYLENGQLIIIRDGVRYNAMGIMIK